MKNTASVISNVRDFINVQDLVGVSSDEIRTYIRKKEDSEKRQNYTEHSP